MWISSRYGPDDNIITQGFLDSIIGHGSAEREFKRHDISRPPARLDGLEAYGWLLGLPAPSRAVRLSRTVYCHKGGLVVWGALRQRWMVAGWTLKVRATSLMDLPSWTSARTRAF